MNMNLLNGCEITTGNHRIGQQSRLFTDRTRDVNQKASWFARVLLVICATIVLSSR